MSDSEIDEIVEEESALPEDVVEHDPPPWLEAIIERIEAIPDAVAAKLPNPVSAEVVEPVVEQVVPDESPAKPPWTHRGMR